MNNHFISQLNPSNVSVPALWFLFQDEQLLLEKITSTLSVPNLIDIDTLGLSYQYKNYLGLYHNKPCFTAELTTAISTTNPIFALKTLRQVYEIIGEELFTIAGRAKQILGWDKLNQFCSYCGNKMITSSTERAKLCMSCNRHVYPLIAPAIIVLINRGNELLLARPPHFTPNVYSTLAGFVEPGETVEEAVHREVMEEVNIRVKNIRYFGSQPWPFPHSLMLGFTAEYASGEIKIDTRELEDAAWFNAHKLPELPSTISISRQLIDSFLSPIS